LGLRPVELAGDVVFNRTEEGTAGISAVAGERQVLLNEALRCQVERLEKSSHSLLWRADRDVS
jgi:hypothetical protein